MTERWRCTKCQKLVPVDALVPHAKLGYIQKMQTVAPSERGEQLSLLQYHKVFRISGGGAGRYGARTVQSRCGPVVVESVSEYIAQFEFFTGETT